MTADEFLAWAIRTGFRGELVDGEVYAMAPERYALARVKHRAARALEDAAHRAGLPCEVLPDGMSIVVEDGVVYEPDALLRCGPSLPPDTTRIEDAIILVEVLSPSSASIDTSAKLLGYFRLPSVRHYLVLDPRERLAIHHARGEGGAIATRILGEGPLTLDPPGLTLEVAALFPPPA
ncbi:Uma2 family endonuclease [Roseicella aquatilis]|uniref:Uma2 family endonuclease n=1 Tax=Roseicella aquatilis TaxID=2527868 RepID=A0A4R4DQH6_9PROT|nr:Uma2 family endonuclease [Roseicella aquatilis]TCZ64359.1 Uma2 family endonuclease [Roseicella aquatilis]